MPDSIYTSFNIKTILIKMAQKLENPAPLSLLHFGDDCFFITVDLHNFKEQVKRLIEQGHACEVFGYDMNGHTVFCVIYKNTNESKEEC